MWRKIISIIGVFLAGVSASLACSIPSRAPAPAATALQQALNQTVTAVLAATASQQILPTQVLATPSLPPTVDVLPTLAEITNSPIPAPTETPLPPASPTPPGMCSVPPESYERTSVNGHAMSVRTASMLQTAVNLYQAQGAGNLWAVTQGSYSDAVSASFGTHAGGGALDVSVRRGGSGEFLSDEEIAPMVLALRQAGFAAWYRYPGSLGKNSVPHIHAIAVGDQELSQAAWEQVYGAGGYLNGFDGLPDPLGPNPDPLGGAILCDWMTQ